MKQCRALFASLLLFVVTACAAKLPPLEYLPGSQVDTLSAPVTLSISNGEQGISSGGYLLYRRPEQMRLAILSPFGTTLMEVFLSGDRITIVNTGTSTAYTGSLSELPSGREGDLWRQARWVMQVDAPGSKPLEGIFERVTPAGYTEVVVRNNGLTVSRRMSNGDEARYGEYQLVNGVPLATEILVHSAAGGRLRIKIDDPEVNADIQQDAFVPNLSALKVLPLAALEQH